MFTFFLKNVFIVSSFFSLIFIASISWAAPWDVTPSNVTADLDYSSRNRSDFSKNTNYSLNQEKYQDAFKEIYSNSSEVGNKNYDILLGRLALKADKPDEAAVACERVLINNPSNPDARLCLSSAYYQLGLYDKAKEEIKLLLDKPGSESLNEKARELSVAINQKIRAENSPYRVYGQLAYGYDNNVATSTDEDYVMFIKLLGKNFEPILGPFYNAQVALLNDLYSKLRKYNEKLKSAYLYPQLGVEGNHSILGSKFSVFWDVNGSYKWYTDISKYDTSQANVSVGLNYQPNNLYLLNATVYHQEYLVNDRRYRETPLLSLGISRALNANNIIRLYTNDGVLMYPNDRTQTIYMYTAGLEWQHFYNRNIFITQIFYGRNQPRGGSKPFHGSNYYGGEFVVKHKLTGKTNVTAGIIYQNSLYDEKEFVDSDRRLDSYIQLSAGLYHRLTSNVVWYVTTAYTNNKSKVFTYEYDRFETLTGINFEF